MPPNPAAAGLTGWLALASSGAVFLQWVQTGDAVAGSLTESISAGTQLQHENNGFTGVVSGSSVRLTFSTFGMPAWNGTLTADQLVVSYPAPDGTLRTLTFIRGTVADYNTAVAQVQVEVGHAQASAQAAQRLQQEQQTIDAAAAKVSSDLQTLSQDVSSLRTDLARVPTDISSEQADVSNTLKREQAVLTEAQQYPDGNNGGVCTDAANVASDAAGVGSAEANIESDRATLNSDISGVQDDETQLQNDFQALHAAEAQLPTYQPANGLPSSDAASSAITAVSATIAQTQQTFAGYLSKAKQLVQTANGYAATAQAACIKAGG